MNMNRVFLCGRLGNIPQQFHSKEGKPICKFSLATSKFYKDNNGERVEKTQWHNVVAFGKTAERIEQYCTKGCEVLVVGEIEYSTVENEKGVQYYTNILCSDIQFNLPKKTNEQNNTQVANGSNNVQVMQANNYAADNVPF